jgi:dTDP-4-dehydrorhamnose reductase
MKVLITGDSGLLGKGLIETKPSNIIAQGVHLRKNINFINKNESRSIDIRNKKCVERLFHKEKYDVIIHAAGVASVDYVKNNYAESLESNIVGTLNISSACRKNGAYLLYISSNAVFDGKSPPYDETRRPNPINEYGEIKLECERLIEKTLESSACIIRPILMYGWNHLKSRLNPVTWVLEKLKNSQKINLVNDVWENPIYNLDCARAIWRIVEKKMLGKIHLAGPEVVNRYQLGRMTAEVFGYDPSLISSVQSSFFFGIAKRPPNTSFCVSKMHEVLKIKTMSIKEGLQDMKNKSKI